MTRCTAVVLTKNEVDNLERCLASLRWCHEMVVVDSGSTDGTGEKAQELGARVLQHRQSGPFNIAEQRNWALQNGSLAEGWILFVDADETIPLPLARALEAIARSDRPSPPAYELTPRYLFWDRWLKRTQGYPNWHARFLKLGSASFAGGVWEHFADGQNVGRVNEPYDHYANAKGFSDWLARHDRYSTWDAQKIVAFLENDRDPRALGTARKLPLRRLAACFWPLRPVVRFCQMYFWRLGFLEGIPALFFCLLYAIYEFMTVVKVVELRRQKRGLPL